jgi:large subunit ribosomal protein L14e
MEIGQLCMKLAGRDAGQKCVVVDVLDNNFVLIDGATRRRKCNLRHLEMMDGILNIKQDASHDEVVKALKEAGIEVTEAKKSSKQKKNTVKPVKQRKALVKAQEEKAPAAAKKAKEKK